MIRSFFVSIILFVVAAPVYAGVIINEVAWMGTQNSAQDEWIELYSDENQNVDGWALVTADGGMSINLSGNINGYYLIERTDDSTVPDVIADLVAVFGSGLSNSGEILTLKNSSGTEVDRVDGSSSWVIGGNNTTKETLQKTSTGWTTAAATPKAENSGYAPSEPSPSGSIENNISNTNSTPNSQGGVIMAETSSKLKTYAGEDRTVLAGAEIGFDGSVSGADGDALNKVRFLWNFGDGKTTEGKTVAHSFIFPGTYNVSLNASLAGVAVSDFVKITVIKNPVILSELKPGGFVEIFNNSSRKIDFSGFGVGIGQKVFVFPKDTFLESYAHLALSKEALGFDVPREGVFQLFYPNGSTLASYSYAAVGLNEKESLSLVDDVLVKSKSTPGEKNEILKQSPKTEPSSLVSGFKSVKKPDFVPGGSVLNETKNADLASVSPPPSNLSRLLTGEYIWLAVGLGVGVLAGLATLFAKRFWVR